MSSAPSFALSFYLSPRNRIRINDPDAQLHVCITNHRGVDGLNAPWYRTIEIQRGDVVVALRLDYHSHWDVAFRNREVHYGVPTRIEANKLDKVDQTILRIRNSISGWDNNPKACRLGWFPVYSRLAEIFDLYSANPSAPVPE